MAVLEAVIVMIVLTALTGMFTLGLRQDESSPLTDQVYHEMLLEPM